MVKIHFPQGPLEQYIQTMVYSKYQASHAIDRLVPDGTVNLIFEFNDRPQYVFDNESLLRKSAFKKVWVSGMHLDYLSISAGDGNGMLVLQFTPLGAHSILHLPIWELNGQVVAADLVLGPEILSLHADLQESSYTVMFAKLEQWCLSRLKVDPIAQAVVDHVVQFAHSGSSVNSLSQVIAGTGYSHRHFNEIFKNFMGLTPKQYQRIIRFNQVLQLMASDQVPDWTSVAYQCGYYDQAHFIKEFKRFSGLNPSTFAQERGEFINYLPIS